MQKFLPFLTLLFLLSLIGFSTYKLNQKQEITTETQIQETSFEPGIHFVRTNIKLPEFSLPNLFDDEENFSKKDLVGKYSIVNFFASWCATCRAEHEILLRLHDTKIVDIYGIAWNDINDNTKEFLEKNGNPFKKVASDNAGLFTKLTNITAVPETLIIDKKGNVVMRFSGNLQEFSIDEIRRFLASN